MYSVLLVDDERIILEGLAVVVEWERHGTALAGKAKNGAEALEMIREIRPDIVITDLKMPNMNGLELIAAVREAYPDIVFVILSGYDEFEYAQRAMQYGVRHYLLKPCGEREIMDTLDRVVAELRAAEERKRYTQGIRAQFEKMKPQLRQQLLKEFLTNKTYGMKEWESCRSIFGLPAEGARVRLILFEPDAASAPEYEQLFALQNISSELIGECAPVHLDAAIGDRVAVLCDAAPLERLMPVIGNVQRVYQAYYGIETTASVSDEADVGSLRRLYKETLESLSGRFYLGGGSIITRADTPQPANMLDLPDAEELARAVRSGSAAEAESLLSDCFRRLKDMRLDVQVAKTYLAELYMVLIRQAPQDRLSGYFERAVSFLASETLRQMERFVLDIAREIASSYYDANLQHRSELVRRMIACVQERLGDETLTLGRLASEVFFMNADYLGRLFRKETGERFSNYLLAARIERAKRLIAESGQSSLRIGAIAEAVGFGNNPQYFSQVFKKHTGLTPTEFKRKTSEN